MLRHSGSFVETERVVDRVSALVAHVAHRFDVVLDARRHLGFDALEPRVDEIERNADQRRAVGATPLIAQIDRRPKGDGLALRARRRACRPAARRAIRGSSGRARRSAVRAAPRARAPKSCCRSHGREGARRVPSPGKLRARKTAPVSGAVSCAVLGARSDLHATFVSRTLLGRLGGRAPDIREDARHVLRACDPREITMPIGSCSGRAVRVLPSYIVTARWLWFWPRNGPATRTVRRSGPGARCACTSTAMPAMAEAAKTIARTIAYRSNERPARSGFRFILKQLQNDTMRQSANGDLRPLLFAPRTSSTVRPSARR